MKKEILLKIASMEDVKNVAIFFEQLAKSVVDEDETTMAGFNRWVAIQSQLKQLLQIDIVAIYDQIANPKAGINFRADLETEFLLPEMKPFTDCGISVAKPVVSEEIPPKETPKEKKPEPQIVIPVEEEKPEPPKPPVEELTEVKSTNITERPRVICDIPEGFVAISGIEYIPEDKYCINKEGKVLNRYKNNSVVIPVNINHVWCIRLVGDRRPGRRNNTEKTYGIQELVKRANFPKTIEDVQKLHDKTPTGTKVKIEQVTTPVMIDDPPVVATTPTTTPTPINVSVMKPVAPTQSVEERWITVDWVDDIPKTKYQVSSLGRVKIFGEIVKCSVDKKTKKPYVMLSASLAGPGIPTGYGSSYKSKINLDVLVIKAFFKSTRVKKSLKNIGHKDGNPANCALTNLVYDYIGR